MAAILAGVDAEVIAIAFLFAVLVGVLIIRPLLVSVLSNAPFIGGWLSSNVDAALASWERSIQPMANGALGVLSSTIDWLTYTWGGLVSTVVGLAQLVYVADWKIVNLVVPAAEAQAVNFAGAAVNSVRADLARDIGAAEAAAVALAAGERAIAEGLFATALAEAQRLAAADEALARGLFAVAESDAAALVAAEGATAAKATAAVAGEVRSLFTTLTAELARVESVAGSQIQALAAEDERAIQDAVRGLTGSIDAAQAAAIASAAVAVSAVAVEVEAIRTSRCFRACDVLGALGEGLQLLDLAVILGLVAAARTNPGAVQQFLVAEVAPAVTGIAAAL